MHERELFGGRVRAGSLGDEPVMRAERVRSVRSSAAAVEGGVRVPFVPFGRLSWSACMTERSARMCGVVGATRAGRSHVRYGPEIGGDRAKFGQIGRDRGEIWNSPKVLPRFSEIESQKIG